MMNYATASPYRPLPLAMRPDLDVVEQSFRGERFYVVSDLLAVEFHRLNDQEFKLLTLLDGSRSIDDIKVEFEVAFAPHRTSHHEIQSVLFDLHQKGVVAVSTSDHGRHLLRLGQRKQRTKRLQSLTNLLAFHWRGINPDTIFQRLTPLTSWFFSKWTLILNGLVALTALLLVGSHFDELVASLPSMREFFLPRHWLVTVAILISMKIAHEFGHGIAFSRLGGRCHELGVMFLAFIPTLYVNTSDSWRLRDKWERIAVSAAGIYVEVFLASVATFGWWYSQSGIFQYACLNVMLLGSISAVLINGNPLLKYDGYYILSDLIEIPNLKQRAGRLFRDSFVTRGLGVEETEEALAPAGTKAWLISYQLASYLYRFLLLYAITIFIVNAFRPVGLHEVAKVLGGVSILLLVSSPAIVLWKYFRLPGRWQRVQHARGLVCGFALLLFVVFFFAWPFSDRVTCDFVVHPRNATTVYSPYDGILKTVHISPNQVVKKGDRIATLQNLDVELEIADLQGRLDELIGETAMIRRSRHHSKSGAGRETDLKEEQATVRKRLDELLEVKAKLVLIAPRDGLVMAEWKTRNPNDDPRHDLRAWDGGALSRENRFSTFVRGQVVCVIGDLGQSEAHLAIDQRDIEYTRQGQTVELLLDSRTSRVLHGRIESISEANSSQVAAQSMRRFGGSIEMRREQGASVDLNQSEQASPSNVMYEAIVGCESSGERLEAGLHGVAKIHVGKATLAQRLNRFLQKTLRVDL